MIRLAYQMLDGSQAGKEKNANADAVNGNDQYPISFSHL